MNLSNLIESEQPPFHTINFILKKPVSRYFLDGFFKVDIVPSPNSQRHFVTPLLEESKKSIVLFAQVFVGVAPKFTTGLLFTTIPLILVAESEQPFKVVTVKVIL